MIYADARAFRQALEQRLKDNASGNGARLVNRRKRILFYRLLARLEATAAGRWMLKGGLALDLRLPAHARTTKDVDIDWQSSLDDLTETLRDAARHDASDFFVFAIERGNTPPERLGGSHRFRVTADLAGRPFDSFQLDVGLGHPQIAEIERIATPDVLAFAGIAAPTVATVLVEAQIAEKLHAYTRSYEGARPSTRVKDLVDLVLVAQFLPVDAATLQEAIRITFSQRAAQSAPDSLARPATAWATPFRDLATSVGVSASLQDAHADASALLDPILDGSVTHGAWNHDQRRWDR